MKPEITIGVCVRNREDYIGETIDSILDQDFPHESMELIIVDDGSEDSTLSVIRDYLPKLDMPTKVIHHEWKGLGPSRNVVVNNARGRYVVWVDSDMTLPANHVRKQVEFMEKNPKAGIGKARYGVPPEDNLVTALENIPFVVDDAHAGNEWKTASKLPGTGGAIYRVKAIRQVGGFNDQLTGTGEDQDAAYRVKEAGWSICRTNAVFYEKRCKTWNASWNKYVWYGCGDFDLYLKNKSIFSLPKMTPLGGFFAGLLYSIAAYRMTHRKVVFLLPIHFTFKMTAWCFGFLKRYVAKQSACLTARSYA